VHAFAQLTHPAEKKFKINYLNPLSFGQHFGSAFSCITSQEHLNTTTSSSLMKNMHVADCLLFLQAKLSDNKLMNDEDEDETNGEEK
jgi:hypothetical protein